MYPFRFAEAGRAGDPRQRSLRDAAPGAVQVPVRRGNPRGGCSGLPAFRPAGRFDMCESYVRIGQPNIRPQASQSRLWHTRNARGSLGT